MHNDNPTRRSKQFKRSPRSPHRFPVDNESRGFYILGQGNSNQDVRRRRHFLVQTDTLRGAMLVAVILVTIVLYILLLELERTSFTSAPVEKPNLNEGVVPSSKAVSTRLDARMAVSSSNSSRTIAPAWPPLITRVAEEHNADDLNAQTNENENIKLASFDATYCNGECRFLLPVRIGEQESKARIHFMQLVMLARQLGRTIVLPNVGKSRMSACSKWPFDAYYDTNTLARTGDSYDSRLAMDLDKFSKWVDERPEPPNGFVVSLDSTHQDHRAQLGTRTRLEDAPSVVERAEIDPKLLSCLEPKLARLRSSLPETALSISLDGRSIKTESNSSTSTRLVKILSDMDVNADFDPMLAPGYEHISRYEDSSYTSLADISVLVLDYNLRHPLFSTPTQSDFNLHYAPSLHDLADRITDNLGPFLGIHWRMESVPLQNLAWCAASLVSTLFTLLQDDTASKSMRYVWLATDHPHPLSTFVDSADPVVDDDWTMNAVLEDVRTDSRLRKNGVKKKSSTFKSLSSEHDHAIKILVESFQPGGDLESWKLTDLAEQLRRYPYIQGKLEVEDALLGDSGVLGILDKLVIVQANAFVTGSTDCSKTSSFSKQVIEARQEVFVTEGGKGTIPNVAEYFGKW